MILIFLTSGLFLGWSLGANDAANVFGTAVGTRMLKFRTAALIASVFVIIGAVVGGSGAAHTLGKLGSVNALAGSFMVALSAGLTVFIMTRIGLPVSTSQAIVGAIIGWNIFAGVNTDQSTLSTIVSTWVLCPVLSALIAAVLYFSVRFFLEQRSLHLLRQDGMVRVGLIAVGAFGSYSLGANNIANVMGVFVPASPFEPLSVYGLFTLSSAQQLFLLGGLAIAVGVYTYSHKVMGTVGSGLYKLSPVTALVVVLSQSLVLFFFSSEALQRWLVIHGLPALPLVPVSSSQAVVGAVIGIGLAKGGRNIKFRVLGSISSGWVTTPIIAGIIVFIGLFIFQNVFTQTVYHSRTYQFTPEVISHLKEYDIDLSGSDAFAGRTFTRSGYLTDLLIKEGLDKAKADRAVRDAEYYPLVISESTIRQKIDDLWFSDEQIRALLTLKENKYSYRWQLENDLAAASAEWRYLEENIINAPYNRELKDKLQYLFTTMNKE